MLKTLKYSICLFALVLSYGLTATAHANQPSNDNFNQPTPLGGYAWSANIGWISFSGASYSVDIQPDGDLDGYAWSPHVGWIRFGLTSGCPTGTCAAQVDFDTNNFSGWARALNSGDGWDGWISLSSDNHAGAHSYGVEVNTSGGFRKGSYAWGSDVVGWVDFSRASFTRPCTSVPNACTADLSGVETTDMWCQTEVSTCNAGASCSTVTNACEAGVDDLLISPPLVRRGETVDISWTTAGTTYSSCRVDGVGGPWTGVNNPGVTSDPVTSGGATFTLYCVPTAGGAEVEVDSETVRVIPTIYES